MGVAVREQREMTRTFDRARQLSLIVCLGPGVPARHDLPGLSHIVLERSDILVVDLDDTLRRETAELFAPEEPRGR